MVLKAFHTDNILAFYKVKNLENFIFNRRFHNPCLWSLGCTGEIQVVLCIKTTSSNVSLYRIDFTCVTNRLRVVSKRLVSKRLCIETTCLWSLGCTGEIQVMRFIKVTYVMEHVSVTKRTCLVQANCCLVPWKILCIGWWSIPRYFWLTHQKFKEISSFVPANYRSTCRKLSNFWQNIVERRTKFTYFFCTILQA